MAHRVTAPGFKARVPAPNARPLRSEFRCDLLLEEQLCDEDGSLGDEKTDLRDEAR